MIIFREKDFAAPALALVGGKIGLGFMAGGTAISAVQGHNANKQQSKVNEEMAEEQRRQNQILAREEKKRTEAYQQSLKSGSVTPPTQSTFSITFKSKEFGNPITGFLTKSANKLANSGAWKKVSGTKAYKNFRSTADDLYQVGKQRGSGQKIANTFAAGATMAGGGYLVDKAIQADMKKNGIPLNKQQEQDPREKKKKKIKNGILAGTAALGTTAGALVMARKGKLNTATFKKGANALGSGFKNQWKLKDDKTGKKSLLMPVMTVAFPAMSGVSYLTQKKQLKEQANQAPQERQYSRSVLGKIGKGVGSFFLGEYNKAGRAKLGNQLVTQAAKSGNKTTMRLAKMVNPRNAVIGTAVGAGLMSTSFKPMTLGEKAVKKPLEKVDKNAFAYEKSQNQSVQ